MGKDSLFEAWDVTLADEFHRTRQGLRDLPPEKRLMLAVLLGALDEYKKHARVNGAYAERMFQEDREWIFSDARDWPYSFVNICETLGVNASRLRQSLSPHKLSPLRSHHQPSRP